MVNYFNKNFFTNFFLIIFIFFLDRVSKFYVISQNEKNLSADLFTSKFLNISLIWNEGIAFGLFSFGESHFYNFLTIIIIIIIIVIFFYAFEKQGFKKIFFFDDIRRCFREFI